MYFVDEHNLKRIASETALADDGGVDGRKRRRVEEVATSSCPFPEVQAQGQTYCYGHIPFAEASSTFSSPKTAYDQRNFVQQPYRQFEPQMSAGSTGLASNISGQMQFNTAWGRQPSLPGCSDISEQTVEDGHSSHFLAPQSSSTLLQPPGAFMQPQRSNSAPDLRILLNGPVNPLPPILREPVIESSSLAGALVPFKAPEEVVQDAVRHVLRSRVQDAMTQRRRPPKQPPDGSETETDATQTGDDSAPMET